MKDNIMKKLIGLLVGGLIVFSSCSKEETLNADALNLGGDKWTETDLDKWIYDEFTKPYNIEVKYKWDRSELEMNKTLVPVQENKVIPVMETLKKTWIKPYAAIKGEDFIKQMSQKQFVLVGSAQYNSNGTITLGQAEGGKKITMFVINNFAKTNTSEVRRMLKTMHHEFGHILHQKKMFSPLYQTITADGYDATWFNYTDAQALPLGFISAYARNSVEDDFVEMLAIMLVQGKTAFDAMVNGAGAGTAALKAKEEIVRSYLKEAYNIDLTELQTLTQNEINSL